MVRKYHNHKLHTDLCRRVEEPQNTTRHKSAVKKKHFRCQAPQTTIPQCQACFKDCGLLRVYGFNTEFLQNYLIYHCETSTECWKYISFIWTNNKKDSHVNFGGHFGSHIENIKNAYGQLF